MIERPQENAPGKVWASSTRNGLSPEPAFDGAQDPIEPNCLALSSPPEAEQYQLTPRRIWRKGWGVLRAQWHLRHAAKIGSRVRISGRPAITIRGNLTVGNQVQLVSTIAALEIVVNDEATLEIGDRVFINYGCSISASQLIRIGSYCKLGTHVIMMDNDFHYLDPAQRGQRPPSAPIILEENVWLAARVIVLRGVTIGADSVIGAGSVVNKDIPPGVFAAGVPAKVIRSL